VLKHSGIPVDAYRFHLASLVCLGVPGCEAKLEWPWAPTLPPFSISGQFPAPIIAHPITPIFTLFLHLWTKSPEVQRRLATAMVLSHLAAARMGMSISLVRQATARSPY
jgi:hypothetical protein